MAKTLQALLDQVYQRLEAADLYFGHGTDNAWDEACWLVLTTLSLPVDSGEEVLSTPVQTDRAQTIEALVEQRIATRMPLAYLLREAYFSGLKFYIDERVLVPRSPFAELIQNGFEPWVNMDQCQKVLELCTGSGCIAIALSHYYPHLSVDATDISADALAVARQNVAAYELEKQVTLIQSDGFQLIPKQQYDLIVANPPYVDASDLAAMPPEYHHEPEIGLGSGDDGLALTRRILSAAADYLSEQGVLVLEVGNSQEALMAAYPTVPFIWLTFEAGGHGVFLIDRSSLLNFFSLQ